MYRLHVRVREVSPIPTPRVERTFIFPYTREGWQAARRCYLDAIRNGFDATARKVVTVR